MKRLVFVNSNTRVKKIRAFMGMKGIENYTLLTSAQEFREELLVNSADIYIFDYYGDIHIIESIMDFNENVNDLFVYANSTRIGKTYSRLTRNIFVPPEEVDFLLHFWETPACQLDNMVLAEAVGKPALFVREPEGLIVKSKKMRVDINQMQIPVIYRDGTGQNKKGKTDQLQVTLRPSGWFQRPEGLVRHQPKFTDKVEKPEMDFTPMPVVTPAKPVKEKPVKEKSIPAPKVVKEKPIPAPKPVKEKPIPAPKVVKEKPVPTPKPVKEKPVQESTKEYAEVNMQGQADSFSIADDFDNTLTIGSGIKAQPVSVVEVPVETASVTETTIVPEVVEEIVAPETVEEPMVDEEPDEMEELLEATLAAEEVSVPEPESKQSNAVAQVSGELFKGFFGKKKKPEKKKSGGFFEKSAFEFGDDNPEGDLLNSPTRYTAKAFRASIITQMDEYMISNRCITEEQRADVKAAISSKEMQGVRDAKFGDVALELGMITEEQFCDIITGFRNIETLKWLQLSNLPVIVDRFDRVSYKTERFFETTPTDDGRVRIIASVNSNAIDEKIRKYAENCIIQYTIDTYITKKLEELEG